MVSQRLLLGVSEQLKVPLLQIARLSEQASASPVDFKTIQTIADNALNLLDNYQLGLKLAENPNCLELEAVSVSAILYDTGQQLTNLAKTYDIQLQLDIAGRYQTVMAHQAGLQAALVSLGAAMIEALPAQDASKLSLKLAAHRCRYGIVAGLYADAPHLSSQTLSRGRALEGRSRQPLANLSHSNAAGIFVADSILNAMQLELKTSSHHKLHGLGVVLQPNHQLQLL